jgi:medium-chain acyl-[acyl-carrier-protein] hydrolase
MPNPQARLSLFCFPYAGGAAMIYRQWPQLLPPSVEALPLQLPGRGSRMLEPLITDSAVLVEQAAEAMRPLLDRPFALFGHSMGALICYELARHLRRTGAPEPMHLFVSGRRAPHVPNHDEPRYTLSDSDLIDQLRRLKGTPPELLQDPEVMQLMLPLVRADFQINENYRYTVEPPLRCPISAYGGLQDREVPRDELAAWAEHTTGGFDLRMFDGGHFFLHEMEPVLIQTVARRLQQHLGGGL